MRLSLRSFILIACVLFSAASSSSAVAGNREQVIRIYSRIAGLPPTEAEIQQMLALYPSNPRGAAAVASSSFGFYNSSLVRFAKPFSNIFASRLPELDNGDNNGREENRLVPLNDLVATVIGMVRDDVPFDQALYGDIYYTGATGLAGVAPFGRNGNVHYRDIGKLVSPMTGGLDLRSKTVLVKQTQSTLLVLTDVAGLLTTRAAGNAFLKAGTNRRPIRFAFKYFLCHDLEELSDASVPDTRVRRDVDRAPAGDTSLFINKCKGCHAGLDGLAGAWVKHDYGGLGQNIDGQGIVQGTGVLGKTTKNAIFVDGYVQRDDSWMNFWLTGPNANKIGWRNAASTGRGANALGRSLAQTRAFSSCMAKRSFELVCLRPPTEDEEGTLSQLADRFELNGRYNLRELIEDAALLPQCRGE